MSTVTPSIVVGGGVKLEVQGGRREGDDKEEEEGGAHLQGQG